MVKPVLAICTIHNNHRTVGSLIELIRTNYFQGYVLTAGALLPQARNGCVKRLLDENPDFTHLIFIDDDMCDFTVDHVNSLIEADKPIISALVTMRIPPYKMVNSFPGMPQQEILNHIKNQDILETQHVGLAFTCIKREVLDRVKEETPDGSIWFTLDRQPRQNLLTEYYDKLIEWRDRLATDKLADVLGDAVAFGQTSHICSSLIGEDISFCAKASNFGIKCYVHMGVIVGHLGTQPITVRDTLKFRIEEKVYNENKGETENEEINSCIIDSSV